MYLKKLDIPTVIDQAVSVIFVYSRSTKGKKDQTIQMAEVIASIGHTIRNSLSLPRDSSIAAKTGAFVLWSFDMLGLLRIRLGKASNSHQAYFIEVLDDRNICELFECVSYLRVEKLPSDTPYAPWTTHKHPSGQMIVKTNSRDVLESLTPETHPIVFDTLNRAQAVGWNVNKFILNLYPWALRNKTKAFAEIWDMQSTVAKKSKIREAEAIGSIASRFSEKTFFH